MNLGLIVATVALLSTTCEAGQINVHVVPHTHDDVGWLKTVDQYYSGANNSIQHAAVRMILDTVVDELQKNPARKFTYIEQAFFQRWWREQTDERKNVTKTLVKNGQLLFANGGWCMHDEAATHYVAMVDQTTLGHRYLFDEFGKDGIPTVAWQLDPFGHSATQAALLSAEAGMGSLFFGRIDYQDLAIRVNKSEAEFIWRASPSLGVDAQVFAGLTGEYGGNYGPPSGFDWDVNSADEPVEDNANLNTYNVKSRVDDFVKFAQWQAAHTMGDDLSTEIMFTMGSDFNYEASHDWFRNLDKIIKYVNLDGRVNAFYSTPAEYVAKKKAQTSIKWPLKTDDFFPYADGPHKFWTGYFTSRPALKRYIYASSAELNAVRQVQAMARVAHPNSSEPLPEIARYEEAIGVAQHHDAASGTAKQHVTFDYAQRLTRGEAQAEGVFDSGLRVLTDVNSPWTTCRRINESVCDVTQKLNTNEGHVTVLVWNQLAQARTELILLPVDSAVTITDAKGNTITSQMIKGIDTVTNYGRVTPGTLHTVAFMATVPPVGYASFTVHTATGLASNDMNSTSTSKTSTADTVIENEFVALTFSAETGRLSSWKNKESNTEMSMVQDFCYYESNIGDIKSTQPSGAYIFRPRNSECHTVRELFKNNVEITVVTKGGVVQEVRQVFSEWLTQTVRLEAGAKSATFEFTVGPIALIGVKNNVDAPPHTLLPHGREVVSRFSTGIASAGKLETDSNGREMIPRQRDFRPTWHLNQTEEVAGNYFPCNAAVSIKDANNQLTVLVDAAQGVASIQDGEIELMVHRRITVDDHRGVGEPLDETQFVSSYVDKVHGVHTGPGLIVRGRHVVMLETPSTAARQWRPRADRVFARPQLFFSKSATPDVHSFTALTNPLPANVQLMTFQLLTEGTFLIRLAHQFGIGEDAKFSNTTQVDLNKLFSSIQFTSIEERTLTANQAKHAKLRQQNLDWRTQEHTPPTQHPWRKVAAINFPTTPSLVTLGPLDIKTFIASTK